MAQLRGRPDCRPPGAQLASRLASRRGLAAGCWGSCRRRPAAPTHIARRQRPKLGAGPIRTQQAPPQASNNEIITRI